MDNLTITRRNLLLRDILDELELDMLGLPHKPKIMTPDFKYWLNAYVRNFDLYLTDKEYDGEVFFLIRIERIKEADMVKIKERVAEWRKKFAHKRVYTLSLSPGLYLSGFNHHNKLEKEDPFPVFSFYEPLLYNTHEKAIEIQERFAKYNLTIN